MRFGTPHGAYRYALPWSWSSFDYRRLCELLFAQAAPAARFDTAKVHGRAAEPARDGDIAVATDRGTLRAPLVVDALGWRRVLSEADEAIQPPAARLSRGLEVHPPATGEDLELWLDPKYVVPGYAWAFPAGQEVRVGVGSFDPRLHVKEPTVELAADLGVDSVRYQGNWIPHRLRPGTGGGVFFAGDSAGHCLPTTAEGIRTALYFGLACGRELRRVIEGRQTREQALSRYHSFNEDHRWAFDWLWRVQTLVSGINKHPAMDTTLALMSRPRLIAWAFTHYLNIAPPSFALHHGRPWAVEPWAAPAAAPLAA